MMIKIPFVSIPFVRFIDEYDIGFWVWSKPEDPSHRVYIERRKDILIAGAEKDGERLIAAIWRGTQGHPLNCLLDFRGKYAENMNSDLIDDEITERIWDWIQGQAITMQLVIIKSKNEMEKNENYL